MLDVIFGFLLAGAVALCVVYSVYIILGELSVAFIRKASDGEFQLKLPDLEKMFGKLEVLFFFLGCLVSLVTLVMSLFRWLGSEGTHWGGECRYECMPITFSEAAIKVGWVVLEFVYKAGAFLSTPFLIIAILGVLYYSIGLAAKVKRKYGYKIGKLLKQEED